MPLRCRTLKRRGCALQACVEKDVSHSLCVHLAFKSAVLLSNASHRSLRRRDCVLQACVETIPTVYNVNFEEFPHRDLIFVVWDMGGPDKLRPWYKPTSDPSTIDAIIFVVDAIRLKHDHAYKRKAHYELWRHLEGDIYTKDTMKADRELQEALAEFEEEKKRLNVTDDNTIEWAEEGVEESIVVKYVTSATFPSYLGACY